MKRKKIEFLHIIKLTQRNKEAFVLSTSTVRGRPEVTLLSLQPSYMHALVTCLLIQLRVNQELSSAVGIRPS